MIGNDQHINLLFKLGRGKDVVSSMILLTLLLTWGMMNQRVWAQDEEADALTSTPSPVVEQEGASDEELEAINEEVKEKVSERLQNIVSKKVALVGIVTELTEEALVIETTGGKKTATLSSDTQFVDQREGNKQIGGEDIEIGATVIAMGWRKVEEEIVDARRVVLVEELVSVNKKVLAGKVSRVEVKENILLLLDSSNNQEWQIELSSKGNIYTKNDGEFIKSKWSEIEEGSQIIAAGVKVEPEKDTETGNTPTPEEETDEHRDLEARLIYIYPVEPTPTPELSPTPEEGEKNNSEGDITTGEDLGGE